MTADELREYDADIILVAPCGFDRKRATADGEKMWRHDWWRELRAVKKGKVSGGADIPYIRHPDRTQAVLYVVAKEYHTHMLLMHVLTPLRDPERPAAFLGDLVFVATNKKYHTISR